MLENHAVLKSDKRSEEHLKRDPITIELNDQLLEKLKIVAKKKIFILESDLKDFVEDYIRLYIPEEVEGHRLSRLTEEGINGVLENNWKASATLKRELELNDDQQIYRKLNKKSHYLKIVINPINDDRKPMARYLKTN